MLHEALGQHGIGSGLCAWQSCRAAELCVLYLPPHLNLSIAPPSYVRNGFGCGEVLEAPSNQATVEDDLSASSNNKLSCICRASFVPITQGYRTREFMSNFLCCRRGVLHDRQCADGAARRGALARQCHACCRVSNNLHACVCLSACKTLCITLCKAGVCRPVKTPCRFFILLTRYRGLGCVSWAGTPC